MQAGELKHRQQVLVRRFKASKAMLSSDVKGPREQGSVCKGQTATTDTITFTCPFWTHALPKPFNYLAWSAKGTEALLSGRSQSFYFMLQKTEFCFY